MMEKRLTLAFWGVLLGIAAWQSPNWWNSATDPRTDTGPVPPAAVAKADPQKPVNTRAGYKVRDPDVPYKIDLRNAKQVAEFFPSPEAVEDGATLSANAPGNSGPFDASGNLIMPLDPRNLH